MQPSCSCLLSQLTRPPVAARVAFFQTTPSPRIPSNVQHPGYLGYLSGAVSSIWAKGLPWTTSSVDAPAAPTIKGSRSIPLKISRREVTDRTLTLVNRLLKAESTSSRLLRISDLSGHLVAFPPARLCAVQEPRLIAYFLEVERECAEAAVRAEARLCLTLCGYIPPPEGAGINLLTIDGGGTRGMMGLEILDAIEKATGGKKVHELFDHIVGVSTGAIIAVLLGVQKRSVEDARAVYMDISRKLFSQNRLAGVSGLFLQHSYYNTKKWIEILKELLGESTMADSAKDPSVPRLSLISSIVNLPTLEPFIFRNYETPAGHDSHYRGSTEYPVWKAIQASAAAPGYFEEVVLEKGVLLQDGGVLANNPTALGVHEARSLWPDEPISCLVSVGNGRTECDLEPTPLYEASHTHHKLLKIIDSATDTEAVHIAMHDLLNEKVYFRLNPYMSHPYGLDEIDPSRLDQMHADAKLYVRRNKGKLDLAAAQLTKSPSVSQRVVRSYNEMRNRNGWYAPP